MPELAGAVEIALIVSALAYGLLFAYSLRIRDGLVWASFRWHAFTGFTGAVAGGAVAHMAGWSRTPPDPLLAAALLVVIISRLANALANFILAIQLRRIIDERGSQ